MCTERHANEDSQLSTFSDGQLKTWTTLWKYHHGKVKLLPVGDHGLVLDAHHGLIVAANPNTLRVSLVAAADGKVLYTLKGKFTIPTSEIGSSKLVLMMLDSILS